MDATSQASLRELNELNFARFDAKLEQRIAGAEARLDQRITGVEANLEQRIAGVEAKLDQSIAHVDAKMDVGFAGVRETMAARTAATETRMIRWMVTLWGGSILTTAGLIIAVLRLG